MRPIEIFLKFSCQTPVNQAIPVADKNLAYEVKVNYLIDRVHILEEDVAKLKVQFA